MNYFDIVFFAIVAVVLILRLRAVLGHRREDEPQRPNPFVRPASGEDDEDFVVAPKAESTTFVEQQPKPLPPPILAPDSLAGALEQVRRRDSGFEEKRFLQNARAAFTMIVGAFAAGDLARLQDLLGPEVYDAFSKAVMARQTEGRRLETKILDIKEAELLRAAMAGDVARLTVRFTSQQVNLTYDRADNLVDGDPNVREEIEDIWTFARNLAQKDPRWMLVETRA